MKTGLSEGGALAFALLCTVLLMAVAGCRPRGEADPDRLYRQGAASDSVGTGRFYQGREIARVRPHDEVAGWLNRPGRETAEFPDRLVSAMDLKQAEVVADVGAGTGYHTFRIAALVPHGRVIAVDIQPEMLDEISAKAENDSIRNIEVRLGTEQDPNLDQESVDVALIVGSYNEFYYPYEMMRGIVSALVPGGRFVLAEYRGEDETLPVPPIQALTQQQARKEMEFVGLRWVQSKDILPLHNFMVFRKPAAEARPAG